MDIEAENFTADNGSAGAMPDYLSEFLDDGDANVGVVDGPESPATAPTEAPVAPGAPQVASPQESTSAPAQVPGQPPEQVQQAPSPAPAPAAPALTQEEINANYTRALEQAYAVNADDATALLTAPETVLPRFATNLHTNVMREVAQHMQNMMQAIPAMLEQHARGIQVEQEARQAFEGVWPGLKSHYDAAVANAKMIRAANPTATREQMIEMTGMMTAMSLGLDPQVARRGAPAQQPAVTTVQVPQPRRPVNMGSGPSALPAAEQNPFTQLANEFLGE